MSKSRLQHLEKPNDLFIEKFIQYFFRVLIQCGRKEFVGHVSSLDERLRILSWAKVNTKKESALVELYQICKFT
jgi:hypothetical protein